MEEMDKKVTGRKEIVAVLEEYPPPPHRTRKFGP
jgi:hypothetical protein